MNCHYCGTELTGHEIFCRHCGTRLDTAHRTEPAAVPTMEDPAAPEVIPEIVSKAIPETVPATLPQTEYQEKTFGWQPYGAPVKQEPLVDLRDPSTKAPANQLPVKRGLGKMIFFGILTFGIYPLVIWSRIAGEVNMVASVATSRMGAKHTVARIRNPEYNDNSLDFMCRELSLSLAINPEKLAARELYNMLKLPSAIKVETFSGRNLEMIEVRLKQDSILDGMRLSEMRMKYNRAKFLVCFVLRDEEVFIPDGNFVLKSGDTIGLTASPAEIQKLLRDIGLMQKQARSVMVLGGSRTAYYLAKHLTESGTDVKIIERDEEHCETLCGLLPRAVIICGTLFSST